MYHFQKGFTLVEMLIVIGVVSVLTGITLVLIDPKEMIERGKISKEKVALAEVMKAVAAYQGFYSRMPNNGFNWSTYMSDTTYYGQRPLVDGEFLDKPNSLVQLYADGTGAQVMGRRTYNTKSLKREAATAAAAGTPTYSPTTGTCPTNASSITSVQLYMSTNNPNTVSYVCTP